MKYHVYQDGSHIGEIYIATDAEPDVIIAALDKADCLPLDGETLSVEEFTPDGEDDEAVGFLVEDDEGECLELFPDGSEPDADYENPREVGDGDAIDGELLENDE